MRGRPTIRDVAAAAGVSHQTVSRVLNRGPNVSDRARERVEAAIAALRYSPSLAARRMGGAKSFLLLAINDRDRTIEDWRQRQGIDWVDQMLFGGMLACAERGYRLIFELVDTHGDHIDQELTRALDALHPDGVILTPPHSDNLQILAILERESIAVARISAFADGPGAIVRMDEQAAAAASIEHLASLGHRRVGFIAGPIGYALSAERVQGYRQAVADYGMACDDRLIAVGDFSYQSGLAAARALLRLDDPPTAIVASNDPMALATLTAGREAGLSVPEQLSVVSFDGTPVVRMSSPGITGITQPIAEMTACAVHILTDPPREAALAASRAPQIVPFLFEIRGSTAALR